MGLFRNTGVKRAQRAVDQFSDFANNYMANNPMPGYSAVDPAAYVGPGGYAGAGQSAGYVNDLQNQLGISGPTDTRQASYGALDAYLDDIQGRAATSAGMSGIRGGLAAGAMADQMGRAVVQAAPQIEGQYGAVLDAYNQSLMNQANQYGRDVSGFDLQSAGMQNQANQFNANLDMQNALNDISPIWRNGAHR